MIRSLVIIALCLAGTARAEEVVEAAPVVEGKPTEPAATATPVGPTGEPEDTSIEWHRLSFDALNERMIGAAAKPVRFDWRKATAGIGLQGSSLAELNNFMSLRAGVLTHFYLSELSIDVGVTRVFTWGTDSTDKLSRTPYRQWGGLSGFELDFGASFPLAEGVVTAWPSFFPASQLVLTATAQLRYLYYPGARDGASFGDMLGSTFSPKLTRRELNNLKKTRPAGMQVDPARMYVLAGLTTYLYFHNGFFVAPQSLLSTGLISATAGSQLGFWWEFSLGTGFAF